MTKTIIKTAGIFYQVESSEIHCSIIETNGIKIDNIANYAMKIPAAGSILIQFVLSELPKNYIKSLSSSEFLDKLNKFSSLCSDLSANDINNWYNQVFTEQTDAIDLSYDDVSYLISYYYYQSVIGCLENAKLQTSELDIIGFLEPVSSNQGLKVSTELIDRDLLKESIGIDIAFNLQHKNNSHDPYYLITPLFIDQVHLEKNTLFIDSTYPINFIFKPEQGSLQVNFSRCNLADLISIKDDSINPAQQKALENLLAETTFSLEQLAKLPTNIVITDSPVGDILGKKISESFTNIAVNIISINYTDLAAYIAAKVRLKQPYLYSSDNRFKTPHLAGSIAEAEDFPFNLNSTVKT